jgi:hypothetical protein
MTNESMAPAQSLEKGEADLLRGTIGFVAQRLMARDVEDPVAAAHGERCHLSANQAVLLRDFGAGK